MAERKRLSETDTSPVNNSKRPKLVHTTLQFGTAKRPLCKYGAKCYRKHPDHLRDFEHPSTEKREEEEEEEDVPVKESSPPPKRTTTTAATSSANSTISLMELLELNDEKLLSSLYQMEFPSDLYEFWKFSSNINTKNPCGMKDIYCIEQFPNVLF